MNEPLARFLLYAQRGLIGALVVLLLAMTVVGVLMVMDYSGSDTEQLFAIMSFLGMGAILMLAHCSIARRAADKGMNPLAVAGAILAAIGTVLLLPVNDWHSHVSSGEGLIKLGVAALVISMALAYTAALPMVRSRGRLIHILAVATIVSAWAAAVCTLLLLLEIDNDMGMILFVAAILGMSILCTTVGTIAVPIALASANARGAQVVESLDQRVQVHLGCPQCGERQTHRPGYARCPKCHAGLFIELEEPRCECGYLLYQLTGDHCPECGKAVSSGPLIAG